jgi:hypothetical protein
MRARVCVCARAHRCRLLKGWKQRNDGLKQQLHQLQITPKSEIVLYDILCTISFNSI